MNDANKWVDGLSDEDLAFIRRFVLASGSLKEMAEIYGISYPTVRLRLDRLIEKIKVYDSLQIRSEFERLVRALCADGRIDAATMKQLLTVHQEEVEAIRELDGARHEERKDQR